MSEQQVGGTILGSFVITLREGFEAALIVGLIMAYLKKTGNLADHARTVWTGVGLAVGFSVLIGAILFATVGELEGTAERLYEGLAMIIAAIVVTWMVFWMRKQASTIGTHLREQVGASLLAGGGLALAAVAFIGVAREGLETALFLFASAGDDGLLLTLIGGALGFVVAIALGVAFYRGALRLDLKRFFTVTGVLVIAFAAWLLSGAVHELGEVAGNEFLEEIGPVVGAVYGIGLAAIYLRGIGRPPADAGAPPPEAVEATSEA
jgi:high-affinity iron transporter